MAFSRRKIGEIQHIDRLFWENRRKSMKRVLWPVTVLVYDKVNYPGAGNDISFQLSNAHSCDEGQNIGKGITMEQSNLQDMRRLACGWSIAVAANASLLSGLNKLKQILSQYHFIYDTGCLWCIHYNKYITKLIVIAGSIIGKWQSFESQYCSG